MDDVLSEFLTECFEGLAALDAELLGLERRPDDPDRIASIFRIVHTIKGTCGFLGLPRLERVAHAAENVLGGLREGRIEATPAVVSAILASLDRIRLILDGLAANQAEPAGEDGELLSLLERAAAPDPGRANGTADPLPAVVAQADGAPAPAGAAGEPAPDDVTAPRAAAAAEGPGVPGDNGTAESVSAQTLRVRLDLLEQLMTLAGELVLTRNQLLRGGREGPAGELAAPLHRLNHITAELQETVMRTRMQPISSAWSRLPRLARDLGLELGKQVDLQLHGGETELDREMLEVIKDPLLHVVRNAIDHGIEPPAERRARGKPERGTLRLAASHEGGHIALRVADDGRGLDTEAIRAKALALGLAGEAELAAMAPEQVHRFIFHPGFSTARQVSSVSGRGVGMDVVRANVERIGGSLELASEPGRGTGLTVKIPLTLAIVSVLVVGAGGQRFGIPQLDVVELVRAGGGTGHRIEAADGAPILRLRDRLLPLLSLAQALGLPAEPVDPARAAHVVVARLGARPVGLLVDRVFDTEEIVIKPLAPILRDLRVFSGTTILGDAGVIMILDLHALLGALERAAPAAGGGAGAAGPPAEGEAPQEATALLLFRAGSPTQKAVPLGLVTRLEEVEADSIEWSGERSLVQYRGQLMPIVEIDGTPARFGGGGGRRPVLVFADAGRHMGLVVDEIIDITEAEVALELGGDGAARLGSAIIHGRSTELLDVAHFVNRVFGGWFADRETRAFAATPGGEERRVLLVDDSPFFRNLLRPILEASGYRVTAAPGAEQALRLRDRGESFDVIVSDIEMPGMNGFEFAAACRAGGAWRATPMVALTSHTTPADLARGRAAGFDDHVGKLDRSSLLASLDRALEPRRRAA
jgi:two-component system, chemotaxis family, sensor kinase CheA